MSTRSERWISRRAKGSHDFLYVKMGKTKKPLSIGENCCVKEAFSISLKIWTKTCRNEFEILNFSVEENVSKQVESLTFGV